MSAILEGIMREGEEVFVIYINGKPSIKHRFESEAKKDLDWLNRNRPDDKIEVKKEVRGGIGGNEKPEEIALGENLHKWFQEKWVRFGPDGKIRGACARGDDSEGKPKCLPQKKAQNLGKKGRKYAAAKKRREDPNPERHGKAINVATKKKTNEERCPHCGGEMVSEELINEKKDACYYKVKSRYKVWPSAYASGALVKCRKKGASNWGTGGKKNENTVIKGIVDEAGSPAQQAAIAINMKKHHKKPKHVDEGDVIPFNKKHDKDDWDDDSWIPDVEDFEQEEEIRNRNVKPANDIDEGVIVGHDANDPEVAILGGAGTMSLSRLKKKAHTEALQLADDIANGKYSASSYNMKQLHNTLNTIVAAEEEMKKLYFGEAVDWQRGANNDKHDHTFYEAEDYLKHVFPIVKHYLVRRAEVGFRAAKDLNYLNSPNPMKHLDDKHFLKSMAHMKGVDGALKYLGVNRLSLMSGSKQVTASIGYTWTTFLSPNKDFGIIYYQDRGMGPDQVIIGAKDKATHRKVYDTFIDAGVIIGRDKKLPEPKLPDALKVSGASNRDDAFNRAMNKFLGKNDDSGVTEDYTGEFATERTVPVTNVGLPERKFRGAIAEALLSEMPDTSGPVGTQPGGWKTYRPKNAGILEEEYLDEAIVGDLLNKAKDKIKNSVLELKRILTTETAETKVMIGVIRRMLGGDKTVTPEEKKMATAQFFDIIKLVGLGTFVAYTLKIPFSTEGMFAIAKLLQKYVGINILPSSIAMPVHEEQLDEACWKGYHKEGNKKMFGKTYPNCVKNTNEEEQLDEKCWDTHKQVGMKNKGGKQVPNCVPKESAIMKGLKR